MLVDHGSCGALTAANLISDTCGYTDAEAMQLVANAPTLIAQSLNREQAVYLAQALTEYGMQVTIYDRYGNQTFTSGLESVFDSAGSFLTKVAASLGLIGIANRITGAIRKLTLPHKPPVYRLNRPIQQRPPVRRQRVHVEANRPQRPPIQAQRPIMPGQDHHPVALGQHPPMQGQPGHSGPRRDHEPHRDGPDHHKF